MSAISGYDRIRPAYSGESKKGNAPLRIPFSLAPFGERAGERAAFPLFNRIVTKSHTAVTRIVTITR